MTAAHCVDREYLDTLSPPASPPIKVVSKAHNFGREEEPFRTYHLICLIKIHRNWDFNTFRYDFALLYLDKKIDFSDLKANSVCLPESSRMSDLSDKELKVSGWGVTETIRSGKGRNSRTEMKIKRASGLRAVKVNGISNRECKTIFKKQKVFDEDNMLCAKARRGGKDACQGDSGGTIILFRNYLAFLKDIDTY